MTTNHRACLVVLLCVTSSIVAACDCDEDDVTSIADFDDCFTSECGWIPSDPARVRIVETIHISQKGMQLQGPVAVTRDLGRNIEEVQLVSNCNSGIHVVLGFNDGDSSREERFVMQVTSRDFEDDPWQPLAVVVREPDEPRINPASITIENVASRRCVIDQIRGLTTPSGCEDETGF